MNATQQMVIAVEQVGAGQPLTMSSKEIAALCNKRHDHVLRDIRAYVGAVLKMERGVDVRSLDWTGEEGVQVFGETPVGGVSCQMEANPQNGQQYPVYHLDKSATLTVVAGYKVLLRKRIIDRWMELEGQVKPLDYSDPRVLPGVMSHLQAQVVERDAVILEQGTRLKTLDRLSGAKGSMCITDAAKTLGIGRDALIQFMSSRRWIFKRPGNKNWLAYDDKRKAMLLDHDDHIYFDSLGQERVSTRALVTAKGLVKLAELLEQPLH